MWKLGVIMIAIAAACSGGESPIGALGGACRPNNECDPGLVCIDDVCRALDAGVPIDSPPDGLACADDSATEPNNSTQAAFTIPVQPTTAFTALAICPAGDQDFYGVTINAANQALEAVISPLDGDPLGAQILNASGTAIAVATPNGDDLRAIVQSIPPGQYFIAVTASGIANYGLEINVIASVPIRPRAP
jgi:hypothetical protein